MRTHVTVLGWLQIALGIVDLFIAAAVFGIFAVMGLMAGAGGGGAGPMPWLAPAMGSVLGFFVALTALPNLLAGIGLLAGKGWARILALVMGAFNVLKFPWGTALAGYTFWVLMSDDARRWFEGR